MSNFEDIRNHKAEAAQAEVWDPRLGLTVPRYMKSLNNTESFISTQKRCIWSGNISILTQVVIQFL